MKAFLEIEYSPLGGFTLERELTQEQQTQAQDHGSLTLPLMGSTSDFDVTMVEHPEQTPFVRVHRVSFSGSPDLPGPNLFRNHMSAYRRNGWELKENTTRGLFTHNPAYKRALMKPVSMSTRLRAYLQAAK